MNNNSKHSGYQNVIESRNRLNCENNTLTDHGDRFDSVIQNLKDDRTEVAAECLNQMLRRSRLNSQEETRLEERLKTRAVNTSRSQPIAYLDNFFSLIPSNRQIESLKKTVYSVIYTSQAYQEHRLGNTKLAWSNLFKAVYWNPRIACRKQLLRLGIEQLVGSALADWIRNRRCASAHNMFELATKSTVIFLSPHLDDVILSCGGTLSKLAQCHKNIIIVTVFTADAEAGQQLSPIVQNFHNSWGNYSHPFDKRKQEDLACTKFLGISHLWLDFQDVIYRYPTIVNDNEIFSEDYDPKNDPLSPKVTQAIKELLRKYPASVLFVPLGLGKHRDHILVYQAIESIKTEKPNVRAYFYYEDFPYAIRTGLNSCHANIKPKGAPVTVDITDSLCDRVHLVSLYESQIEALFGNKERMREEIERYAEQLGAIGIPRERYWLDIRD